MATGYNLDGSPAPLYDFGWISPAGQMFSTTHDLDRVKSASLVTITVLLLSVYAYSSFSLLGFS